MITEEAGEGGTKSRSREKENLVGNSSLRSRSEMSKTAEGSN